MNHFAVGDDFFDGQTLRAAATAPFGGADVLECVQISRRVRAHDLDSWYDEWSAAADRALALGQTAENDGQAETARLAFLRATTYYRTAGSVYLAKPVDPRLSQTIAQQTSAFRKAMVHTANPVDAVQIEFESMTLPGYYYRVADDGRRRATVILLNGYDGTVEEAYFGNARAALDRGYDVLAFDGPGQGSVLVDQGIPLRPDWENVLPTVVDWLIEQPGVDVDRIGIIGWSLGGHLAPRAASGEHRLAACISDSGFYDLFDSIVGRIPAAMRGEIPDGNRAVVAVVSAMMDGLMHKPTGGWSLRRGLYVNGVDSVMDYVRQAREYTLKGYAEKITCPTLICHGESDDVSASAPILFDALTCPKQLITFLDRDGAGGHCEMGARQLYLARTFGWLDGILDPHRLA
ncbi:MAG: alpha/beta hydrolase family protein [Leucobacter sp.]